MTGHGGSGGGAPLLLGLDLGTQSAKVVVHDVAGGVLAQGRAALRAPLTPAPGRVEHPDDDLWEATGRACRDAVAALLAAGREVGDVVGIGVCGIRCTRALLRADLSLSAPVLSWMDERTWHAHDPADAPGETAFVTTSSGYLTARLTGTLRDAAAAHQHPWPIDPATWDWAEDADDLAAYGLRRGWLADLVEPGGVLGTLTTQAARHTGLPVGLPVVATANDKAVEALGAGLRGPGDVLLSLGTYVAGMVVGEADRPDLRASWTNLACVPGRYLHESGGIRRGMWTVSWLRDLLGRDESALEVEAVPVPIGSEGLVVVPDWLAPPEEPHRRGALVGLDARHGAGHLYRAVLEGLVVTLGAHVRAMTDELDRPIAQVVLGGGGGGSALARQMVADVLDAPVRAIAVPSAAALGSAMCAAVGVGVHPGFDAALEAMTHPGTTVAPDPAGVAAYAGLEPLHRAVRDALDRPLRDIHRWTGPAG